MADVFEVAVLGAGLAGLICARQLQHLGYRVVVIEKSRGVGGRMATRRIDPIWVDHGLPHLEIPPAAPELMQAWVEVLLAQQILQPSPGLSYRWPYQQTPQPLPMATPRYIAPPGIKAIAQFLSPGLDLRLEHQVVGLYLAPHDETSHSNSGYAWQLICHSPQQRLTLEAGAVVSTLPAPQTLTLVSPLEPRGLAPEIPRALEEITYQPCLTLIAGYSPDTLIPALASLDAQDWLELQLPDHPTLARILVDSRKRPASSPPVLILHSTPDFASRHLDTPVSELTAVGLVMQTAAATLLPGVPPPIWTQIHRWRYAQPSITYPAAFLQSAIDPLLIFGGDWCGAGTPLMNAFESGLALAERINQQLRRLPLPEKPFFASFSSLP